MRHHFKISLQVFLALLNCADKHDGGHRVLHELTLAAALPVQAVQDLLVIFGLVAVLLQVSRSVAGILCQHQLDVSTQRQALAVKLQYMWVQGTTH